MATKKSKRKGSKSSGAYVGLLNGASARVKSAAKKLRAQKGVVAAVSFLRKSRKKSR